MKSYQKSDYAINKYSSGIVYRMANKIIEINLSEYLKENPGKTEQDFKELKALSDEIYLEQVRKENASTKKNITLHNIEKINNVEDLTIEEKYIEKLDKENSILAFKQLLKGGNLTEIQKHRFIIHTFKNLSLRQITKIENVDFSSIRDSINLAKKTEKNI